MAILFDTSASRLPIPETVQENAWRSSQESRTPGTRLQRYLNQACLSTLNPWIAEASGQSPQVTHGSPARWDLVNGSAVQIGELRLIMIPSEAMDREEFSVPQEWVDASTWVGDYYLAVEVDTDEQWVEPWGYVTHGMLKTQGQYDPIARAYTLESDRVISDLSVLWVMMERTEPTRAAIPTPLDVTSEQAQQWIQQIADASPGMCRWTLAPEQWCALIANESRFQQLCALGQESSGEEAIARSSINLGAWLDGAISAGWATLDSLFPTQPNWAMSVRNSATAGDPSQRYAKSISLSDALVILAIAVQPQEGDRRSLSIQVLPTAGETYLPDSLRLAMYSTSGDEVQSVTADDQTRFLQLRPFRCAAGTTFQLRISTETTTVDETFVA